MINWYTEAMQEYNNALDIDSNNWEAHYNKASLLHYLSLQSSVAGNTQEALAYIKQAFQSFETTVNLQPNNISVRLSIAKCLMTQLQFQQALIHLKYALSLSPDNIDAHISIIEIYSEHLHNHQETINACNKYLQYYDFIEIHKIKSNALIKLAAQEAKMGQKNEAQLLRQESIDIYEQILEKWPDDTPTLLFMLSEYGTLQEHKKCLEGFQRLVHASTENLDADNLQTLKHCVDVILPQAQYGYEEDLEPSLSKSISYYAEVNAEVDSYAELKKRLDLLVKNLDTRLASYDQEIKSLDRKLEEHNKIIDNTGIKDLSNFEKEMFKLEKENHNKYLYAKTVKISMYNYINVYKSLSTGLVHAELKAFEHCSGQAIKFGAKSAIHLLSDFVGCVPVVGGVIKSIDNIVDLMYHSMMQNQQQNKGKTIVNILQSKFNIESKIEASICKISLDLANLRENELEPKIKRVENTNQYTKYALDLIKSAVEKCKNSLLPPLEIEDHDITKIAIRDVILVISYMYSYPEQFINSNLAIEELIIAIIKNGQVDEMLCKAGSYLQTKEVVKVKKHIPEFVPSSLLEKSETLLINQVEDDEKKENNTSLQRKNVKSFLSLPERKSTKCVVMHLQEIVYDNPVIDYLSKHPDDMKKLIEYNCLHEIVQTYSLDALGAFLEST